MLSRVAALEDNWHMSHSFATPEKLRLQQQLRTGRLKCDMHEPLGPRKSAMLSLLAQKAGIAPAADV
eukprot:564393-Pleurochrysis_carterae.AAC.1